MCARGLLPTSCSIFPQGHSCRRSASGEVAFESKRHQAMCNLRLGFHREIEPRKILPRLRCNSPPQAEGRLRPKKEVERIQLTPRKASPKVSGNRSKGG